GDTNVLHINILAPTGDTLLADPASLNYSFGGATKSVHITSNINWNVTTDQPSWISLGTISGSGSATLNITASANDSAASRSGTVTITGGLLTRVISIVQDGIPSVSDSLSLSSDTLQFEASADSNSITL